jgi:hypothetical protein
MNGRSSELGLPVRKLVDAGLEVSLEKRLEKHESTKLGTVVDNSAGEFAASAKARHFFDGEVLEENVL